MLFSMTGFSRVTQIVSNKELIIEIKTLNHKGLDIIFRSGFEFYGFESTISKYINRYIQRGRVEIYLGYNSENNQTESRITFDHELAQRYYREIKNLAAQLHMPAGITVGQLLNLPGIVRPLSSSPLVKKHSLSWNLIEPAIKSALDEVLKMRKIEGGILEKDIIARLKNIERNFKKIRILTPRAKKEREKRLKQQIRQLLVDNNIKIESSQIIAAASSYFDQSDISEELVRIESHINQFYETVRSGKSVGRRLDFIIQELFREFNTIGAKAFNPDIGKKVVDIKTDLDKTKQQIANIE